MLGLLVGATTFSFSKSPLSVAVYKRLVESVSVPCFGLEPDRWMATADLVNLDRLPGGDYVAA